MIVMLRPEILDRLLDEPLVRGNLFRCRRELGIVVGDHVERDVG